MWKCVGPPKDGDTLFAVEEFIANYTLEKIGQYDGTIFFCCSPKDRKRMDTFVQAAQAAGRQVLDVTKCCTEVTSQGFAKTKRKKAFFVRYSMREYLEPYLAACPVGMHHMLFYSRRFGNGPSPYMNGFFDFWVEQGVDIWDLENVDKAVKGGP